MNVNQMCVALPIVVGAWSMAVLVLYIATMVPVEYY